MEHDPRQSIHEIGLARQLFLSSARPAVVTVRSTSREDKPSKLEAVGEDVGEEVGGEEFGKEVGHNVDRDVDHDVGHDAGKEVGHGVARGVAHSSQPLERLEDLEQLEQFKYSMLQRDSGGMATTSDLQRSNTGPGHGRRVVFKKSEDDWSMFPNPACTHERHCGHRPRPRILFEPEGVDSDGRGSQVVPDRRRPGDKRHSLPATTSRRSPTSHPESLYSSQAGETMEGENSNELPASIGPFLLKSLSSDSIAEGRATTDSEFTQNASATDQKNPRALQKEFYATRTTDWVANVDPEAPVPGHTPPLASIADSNVENTDNAENMGNSRGRNQSATPIRGNFIPLSTSFKERSPSPRREQGSNGSGVYLQFSLTDSQMDRLTAALSSDDNEPPVPPIPARSRATDIDREDDTINRTSKESAASSKRSRSPAKASRENTAPGMRSRSPARTSHGNNTAPGMTFRSPARVSDENAALAMRSRSPARVSHENTVPGMHSRSPAKTSYQSASTPSRTRSRSPVKFNLRKTPESQRTLLGLQGNTTASPSKAKETRFELDTPAAHESPTRTSGRSSGRSGRTAPAPIDTDLARAHARMAAVRIGKQPAVVVHNPPERASSPVRQPGQYPVADDDSSSYYSQDSAGNRYPSCISPLRIQKDNEPKHLSILQAYTETAFSDTKTSARGSDKASEVVEQQVVMDEASSGAELAYTPLAPFLPQQGGGPTVRKASKTLIGEGGWLENTSKREPAASPTRTSGGFLGNLVKKAKEMIEGTTSTHTHRKSDNTTKSPTSRQLAISLSPREQSLLYCELEFTLTTALADYLTSQFAAGRLCADKLRRTAEDWQRKGRPKVVGFRYDMETQLDLVRVHVGDFKFYSRAAATTAILGVLDTAKANARVLRVRTFCQPDTVIAKQLLDSQGLFNVLGCPEGQQIKLAEVVAFFKAGIERRRVCELRERMQMEMQLQQQQQGVGVGRVGVAATSPVRNSRSPRPGGGGGEDWYGTAAAGAAAGQQQMRGNGSTARRMDPAGYESQE